MNKPNTREGFVAAQAVDEPDKLEVESQPVQDSEWPLIIKIMHKPLRMPGDDIDIHELVFREPTAGDIIRAGGNPCRIDIIELSGGLATYQPVIDDRKMLTMMAMLSGVLEPVLQNIDTRDYNSCAHRLRRYFLPEQGLW